MPVSTASKHNNHLTFCGLSTTTRKSMMSPESTPEQHLMEALFHEPADKVGIRSCQPATPDWRPIRARWPR
jgi:hypothetical protein